MNAEAKDIAPVQKDTASKLHDFLLARETEFSSVATKASSDIVFERECNFAKQQILKNDFTLGVARNNMQSLHNAIINVASVGLSLSPANQYAFLVPRDKAICLDISYRGLCKLATDTGVIKWVQAEMVYTNDDFKLRGFDAPPLHDRDPFSDRGEFKGVYCVAKTSDGDFLTTAMKAEDIYKIRDMSQAYMSALKYGKTNSVWHLWLDQMALKTVVKRASKLWPGSDGTERLNFAVDLLNQQDGSGPLEQAAPANPTFTPEQKEAFDTAVAASNAIAIWHMNRTLPTSVYTDLCGSGEKGQKTRLREIVRKLESQGSDIFNDAVASISAYMDGDDSAGALEIVSDFEDEISSLIEKLSPEAAEWLESLESE